MGLLTKAALVETCQTPCFTGEGGGWKCLQDPPASGPGAFCDSTRGQVSFWACFLLSCYRFGSGPGTWGWTHEQHRTGAGQGRRVTCPPHRRSSTCHLHSILCDLKGKGIPHSPYYSRCNIPDQLKGVPGSHQPFCACQKGWRSPITWNIALPFHDPLEVEFSDKSESP